MTWSTDSYGLPSVEFPDFSVSPLILPLSQTRLDDFEGGQRDRIRSSSEADDHSDAGSAGAAQADTQPYAQPIVRSPSQEAIWGGTPPAARPPSRPASPPNSYAHRAEAEGTPPPIRQPLATSAPVDERWEDEEEAHFRRALELSKVTAEEDERRRIALEEQREQLRLEAGQYLKTTRPESVRSPGSWPRSQQFPPVTRAPADDVPLPRSTSVRETKPNAEVSQYYQTQPQPSMPSHVLRQPPGVSPLSSSEQASMTTSAVSAMSRALSNTYRPQRIPLSSSPPPMDRPQRSPTKLSVPESRRPRASSNSSTSNLSIRDDSRTRSGSSVIGSGEMCDDCQLVGPHRSYCNVCMLLFCDACWVKQLVHRRNRSTAGSIPHEKTEHIIARKVQEVLTPDLTDADREKLHTADIDTTWFGVAREENELPLFRDYGRYANLIAENKDMRLEASTTSSATSDHSETLYPSLVSFVGQTGAGKSTLIKLLIDLKAEEGEGLKFPTPVTGAAGRDVSTSEDVHLYLDPDSSESQAPLLFADCEGLEGGERDPVGAKLKKKMERQAKIDAASGGRRRQRLKHTSERELIWADTARKQSRDFAVANLYPRLLYTFSDVIVFVLKNPRVIESVLERLVDWAQAALEKSSNQPVLPHAIIAFNASENDIPEELWDVDHATTALMESLSRTVFHNATFKKYAQFWRERDRQIESVEQLILSYYSSVRVVRIPTTGRPNLIRRQVEQLSGMVRWASRKARERKADLRMLLDADDFQPYLQVAFDHFAQNLNTPFDFVQASFTNSPIPNDFGGNILKLALQVMECWKDQAKGTTIFEELSYVVASCIMLDAARHKIRGDDDQIFPTYLEHLDNALENFCDRHWPCEFVGPKGGRCINVRSGHGAKGHQLKSGKLLAAGDYIAGFSFDGYRQQFQESTYYKLKALRKRVKARIEDGVSEQQAAAEIHRELVLPAFLEHASRGDAQAFISHTVCFCCLFEPPEHALPCGHIICTPCLKAYGKAQLSLRGYVEISDCPMEKKERHFRHAWPVYLKPPSCGVRVLTLDGGGIRGIVELEILKYIEKELGGGVNVQSFFDLIVGTSTGGIIALGLTARNWTLDECINHFQSFCTKAFTLRKGMSVPGVSWIVSNYNHSKYETQPLQEALVSAFSDEQYLFGGRRSDPGSMDVKVAVTATSAAGNGVVLANYNRLCLEKLSYHFQRPEKLNGELKTWEAARATSAAPTYFKPLCHESSKQVYSDGGIYHNNPIHIADRERKLIWPTQQDEEPDIIVSIGTTFCRKLKEKGSLRFASRGIVAHGRFKLKMAQDHLHTSLDSEKTWRDYYSARAPKGEDKQRYVRINPELQDYPPKLDDVDQMRRLQESTRYLVGESPQIKLLARQLVATCFYLDVLGDVKEDTHGDLEISGEYYPDIEYHSLALTSP